jgi:3-(3-hydroxy-phenyl)propionate hydroxylase
MSQTSAPRRSPEPPDLPASTDVLIVGYGPVGATIACLLGRYGVRAVVIDKATDILMMPRAIGLDDEAQRTLQMAGLADDAFAKLAISECRMHSPYAGEFLRFNSGGVVDGHAKLVMFYQPDLERALRAAVDRHPSIVPAAGVELIALSEREGEDGARARLRRDDGSETELRARYVVGADGASSLVRRLIGQDFRGRSYAEDWLIVDAGDVPNPIDHIDFYCQPRRPGPHIPAPGNRERWEFMLDPGEAPEEMERTDRIKELLAPWGDPADMRIERRAVYRFHARCCDSFRRGRVFLAGDAAHVTPPFVGQGLVSGLRDAGNLSWKLAWVLSGRASTDVLDSYDIERRPHAKAMIDLARFMGKIVMPRSALRAALVHGLIRALRVLRPVRRLLDDMKMKPRPRFRRGLFLPGGERLVRGAWLPQGLVRGPDGSVGLSDEALGADLALVGFGVDPRRYLDRAAIGGWQAIGGRIVQIALRSQVIHRAADAYEDLTGALIPGAAPFGWTAVVRPDRTVLHDGPVTEVARLVAESRALLGLPAARGAALAPRPEPAHSAAEANGAGAR